MSNDAVRLVRDILLKHTELAAPDAIGVAHLIVDALGEGGWLRA